MKRYTTQQWFSFWALIVWVCLSVVLGGCGKPRVDTGITGEVMQCSDGPHHVLNCQIMFDQYKRDFAVGLKLFDSIGAQTNVPVRTLIEVDTLTGELMMYRQSLCYSFNNCLLSRELFVEEERKLVALQYDLRKVVGLARQQGFTNEFMPQNMTNMAQNVSSTDGSAPAAVEIRPLETNPIGSPGTGATVGGFSETSRVSETGEVVSQAGGAPKQPGMSDQFVNLANAIGNSMKAIMRGRQDLGQAPGTPSLTPIASPNGSDPSQQALVQQVETVLSDLTNSLARNSPKSVGSEIVVGNMVDQQHGYETPFSRYLATLIDTRLSVSKQHQVVPRQGYRGLTVVANPKQPNALAQISGAQMVLDGKQTVRPDGVAVQLTLVDGTTAKPLATASTLVPKNLIPSSYPANVNNAQLVEQNTAALQALGNREAGNLKVEVWTDRGSGASYYEGEKMFVHLRVTTNSHVRLFYIDAENNVIQIFPNAFHSDDSLRAGEEIIIPSQGYSFDFVVAPPFGVEQIAAIVSENPIPELAGQNLNGGRKLLTTSMRGVVQTLRGSTAQPSNPKLAWDSVVLTTISRGRQATHQTPQPTRVAGH